MKRFINIIIVSFFAFFTYTNMYSQCEDTGNVWNESWVSCQKTPNPNPARGTTHWILYEFHEPHSIETSHIWNANRNNESGWGATSIAIDYSIDGQNWITLSESFDLPEAPESDNYSGIVGPDFEGQIISKILITILSTYSNEDCASIAEFQFNIDPETCIGEVDECGICNGPGAINWYLDADNDGLGTPATTLTACEQPPNFVANNNDLCDDGRLGWDNVEPLFEINGCLDCHGAGQTSGLDLRTYEGISSGGNKCGSTLLSGTHLVSIISEPGYQGCETVIIPSMNNLASGEFDAEELAILQLWIDKGALEYCTDFCEFSGQPCDDEKICTVDDMFDNNCKCVGTFVDIDQDGVCAPADCDDNDPSLPAPIGIGCNDNNPNTQNDVIQSDGCTCLGTNVPDACNVSMTSANGGVTITGLSSDANVKLFDGDIEIAWSCDPWHGSPCQEIEIVTGLVPGETYFLSVVSEVCQEWLPIVIIGGEYPSCFDDIQNQGEAGIDCGGPCEACECNVEISPYFSEDGIGFQITGLTELEVASLFDMEFNGIWQCNPWNGVACSNHITIINLPGLIVGASYYLIVQSPNCDLWITIMLSDNNYLVDIDSDTAKSRILENEKTKSYFNNSENAVLPKNLPSAKVNVFPNPTADEIYIQAKDFIGLSTKLSIQNQLGVIIRTINIDQFPEDPYLMRLGDMPSGIYYITLQSEDKVSVSNKVLLIND